jgi:hypothetical protein
MTTNVNTSAASTQDFNTIDQIINLETKRKISKVANSKDFGILTACFIDGEFVCVSDYDITDDMRNELEKA